MNITTRFSPGDSAWVFNNDSAAKQLTIGQVRVVVTDSPGTDGEERFHNYMAQSNYTEEYMCVETGIGSGSVYTLGKNIFSTEAECLAANADRIAEATRVKEERRQFDLERAKSALRVAQREVLALESGAL